MNEELLSHQQAVKQKRKDIQAVEREEFLKYGQDWRFTSREETTKLLRAVDSVPEASARLTNLFWDTFPTMVLSCEEVFFTDSVGNLYFQAILSPDGLVNVMDAVAGEVALLFALAPEELRKEKLILVEDTGITISSPEDGVFESRNHAGQVLTVGTAKEVLIPLRERVIMRMV